MDTFILAMSVLLSIFLIINLKNFTVVAPDEIHVLSGGARTRIYDGVGRYIFMPLLLNRSIIKKQMYTIEVSSLSLHDMDKQEYSIDVKCNVAINNPIKFLETFTPLDFAQIQPVVKDVLISTCLRNARNFDVGEIVDNREGFENSVYISVGDKLKEVGLRTVYLHVKEIYR